MKSVISNWRKTHGRCDQTSGFNWDASVFASEDVSFSLDSDSNATLHKSFYHLFMLHYFSMSWNAMFLVLLTLYCVIHFIINSLHNITLSVLDYFRIVRIVIIFTAAIAQFV